MGFKTRQTIVLFNKTINYFLYCLIKLCLSFKISTISFIKLEGPSSFCCHTEAKPRWALLPASKSILMRKLGSKMPHGT